MSGRKKTTRPVWVNEAPGQVGTKPIRMNKLVIAILTAIYSGAYHEHVAGGAK